MNIDNIDYSKLTELDQTDRLKASQKINSVKYEIKQSQSLKRRINKEIRETKTVLQNILAERNTISKTIGNLKNKTLKIKLK